MILDKTHLTEIDPSETVIYKYRPSYEELEEENKRLQHFLWEEQELNEYLQDKINKLNTYIEKMSYCDIIDNPKKELSRILERENK